MAHEGIVVLFTTYYSLWKDTAGFIDLCMNVCIKFHL